MKTEERERARLLRRDDGLSVRDIATALGVSRSSVSLWVRDIELTAEQHEALLQRNPAYNRQRRGQAVWSAQCRSKRRKSQAEGRAQARRGEALHAAGCMLYWAEGGRNRNAITFTNSDPEMIRLFVVFLRKYFDVPDEKIRVWCNLFADHAERQTEVEEFWLSVVGVPRTRLTASTVNVYSRQTRRKRTNMLPYGTCRVTVHSTAIVQHIYGAIQEYAGFDRPEWLG